ncbi:hypothetical protein CCUS01_01540 [Colletotrichum cuscutae]|uniref:Uncharacterized protein n=1 Tax=Colletotrichum cuscutae TaxID=1209917 RepID=A0AAI9XT19_9PEZI|nr:hypothetical protein CCUS01_01540 [Colletotrichum cuscutae]
MSAHQMRDKASADGPDESGPSKARKACGKQMVDFVSLHATVDADGCAHFKSIVEGKRCTNIRTRHTRGDIAWCSMERCICLAKDMFIKRKLKYLGEIPDQKTMVILPRVHARASLPPNQANLLIAETTHASFNSEVGKAPDDPASAEEWAFQTVLGIILAGLLREAVVKETGVWISLAYRLTLEHCPSNTDERSREWQRLFSGLQIVDLEHASIHLSCPVIPIEAPLPRLKIPIQDQLYRLSRMMHTGLTHFTGRGLPTIWSCFQSEPSVLQISSVQFSGVDGAVIRDWARQLDDWLVEFSDKDFESEHEKKLVFRQYILHRLLVLSIYHPARGCNLFSNTTPKEQHELLVSARAAVKLQILDASIWSNWDPVMITWAALIVLQGVDGGVGEPDDLENVGVHLQKLKEMHEPKPSLRGILATRLEQKLQGLHTPASGDAEVFEQEIRNLDNSWYIFDQSSLQAGYELWSYENQGGWPLNSFTHSIILEWLTYVVMKVLLNCYFID